MGVRKEFEWEWEAPLSLWGDLSFVEVSGSHRDGTARPEPDPQAPSSSHIQMAQMCTPPTWSGSAPRCKVGMTMPRLWDSAVSLDVSLVLDPLSGIILDGRQQELTSHRHSTGTCWLPINRALSGWARALSSL